jgi:hypothetical protein
LNEAIQRNELAAPEQSANGILADQPFFPWMTQPICKARQLAM